MKYLLLLLPLSLVSCGSIKFVTLDHGHMVTDAGTPVHIVGNPLMVCHYANSPQTFEGYFMYTKDDGKTIVLDDFGRGSIELMDNPICKLGPNE